MKKEIIVTDKESNRDMVFTVTDKPINSVDLLINAASGYLDSLKTSQEFLPQTQLTREVCLSVAKAVLPSKYTTTIRE